jgi:methylase of polypeptide subunit release factors
MVRHDGRLARVSYPAYRRVMEPVRRSRPLAKRLFGVECPAGSPYFLWDLVTLGLRRVLMERPPGRCSLCDMGCGPVAALTVLAAKLGYDDVTAVDVVPEFVEYARQVLDRSGVRAEVIASDFDRELGERTFDLVVHNSAYIPDEWGERQGINRDYPIDSVSRSVTWSGGLDGTASIREFLARMPSHLRPGGQILLGFNRLYVPASRVESTVLEAGLTVERRWAWRLLPAVVLEMGK